MSEAFLKHTCSALGDEVFKQIQDVKFCIVGCGGTGALFAEMLVRTGAENVSLVDGDFVEESNLNRVVSFLRKDLGDKKVDVLKSRFGDINPEASINAVDCHLREFQADDCRGQKARDCVYDAEIVVLAVDNNKYRIECEELCRSNSNIRTLGVGVFIKSDGTAGYEVNWCGKTPPETIENEGYGEGSYASIVIEAASVAFSMLLHHLKVSNQSSCKNIYREFRDYFPKECSCQ